MSGNMKRDSLAIAQEEPFVLFDLPGLPRGNRVRKILVSGERPADLTVYLGALAASFGLNVLVADGANTFDPYVVAKFARKEGLNGETLLKQIAVARAFTCYQLTTLVGERLDPMVPAGTSALVVLLGPCNMFFDEDVPVGEAVLLFRRMLAKIQILSEKGIFFLMSQSAAGGNQRRLFFLRELKHFVDAILKLRSSAESLQVVLDKPPLMLPRPWEVFEEFKRLT
jgi:hypothetical protein